MDDKELETIVKETEEISAREEMTKQGLEKFCLAQEAEA